MSTSNNKDQEEIERLKTDKIISQMTKIVAESIVSNKLVLFIGAGFAMNLGMQSWNELVKDLYKDVDLSHDKETLLNNLMECGYYGRAIEKIPKLSNNNISATDIRDKTCSIFLEAFDPDDKEDKQMLRGNKVYRYLKELHKCGAKKIVTTNYDRSIKTCLGIKDDEILRPTKIHPMSNDYIKEIKNIRKKIIKRDEYYIQLHGYVDSEELENSKKSLVLSETDYRNHYVLNGQIPSLLQELFTHNRILFLGCGLDDRYMDIFEKLYNNQAVMDSYVICTTMEHKSVAEKTGTTRIPIKDYIYLDDVLEMILEKTRKIQQEKSKKILFSALPLEDYDYESAEKLFSQASMENIKSCFFFNTQVEFSAWFSPALQIYLTQQMKAYSDHKNDGFKHYRIFFLPFDKSGFADNLNDYTFKQDVKAMVKLHKYMNCQPVFITTDMLQDIIEKNNSFFDQTCNLKCLGMTGYPEKGLDSIIREQNKNGYRNPRDLDFMVIIPNSLDKEQQIWQANYTGPNSKKFEFTNLKESEQSSQQKNKEYDKYDIYKKFSGMIIDYINQNLDNVFNPKLNDVKKLSQCIEMQPTDLVLL